MKGTFKIIFASILIFVLRPLTSSSIARLPADTLRTIHEFTGGLDGYFDPVNKAMRKESEQWIIRNATSLPLKDLNRLTWRFIKSSSSNHSQELVDAVLHATAQRLPTQLQQHPNATLKGIIRAYRAAVGEQTMARRRYKAMYTDALIRLLPNASVHIYGPLLPKLLQVVCFRTTNAQLRKYSYDFTERVIVQKGISPEVLMDLYVAIFNGGHTRQNADFLAFFTQILAVNLVHLPLEDCIRLAYVFDMHADNVDAHFMQSFVEYATKEISNEIHYRMPAGRKLLYFAGAAFLKHNAVLNRVGVTFTVNVSDDVETLNVSNVYFDEDKLSAFRFGENSQMKQIVMNNHGYDELTYDNFARYFGVAAQGGPQGNNCFYITARGGQWFRNTVDIRLIGVRYLCEFVVDDPGTDRPVRILNSAMIEMEHFRNKLKNKMFELFGLM